MAKLLLIDGDVVAFRAAAACEKTKYLVTCNEPGRPLSVWDDCSADAAEAKKKITEADKSIFQNLTLWSRKELEPEDKALMLVDVMIRDILARYPEHKAVVWLSPSVGNFREKIATRAKYKGNRDHQPRPKHLKAVRQHLAGWGAKEAEGQEADDALGIEATANPGSVIVSNDKDLKQIPGLHYDFTKKEEFLVSPKQAGINFWSQVLTGDSTDNIPGIDGIGPAKAGKLLAGAKNNKECQEIVQKAYADAYGELAFDYFRECAALVFIRRQPGKGFEA